MSAQQIVYILSYRGVVLGVYEDYYDAVVSREGIKAPGISSIEERSVKPKGTRGVLKKRLADSD